MTPCGSVYIYEHLAKVSNVSVQFYLSNFLLFLLEL
jgi:hypothetical protein